MTHHTTDHRPGAHRTGDHHTGSAARTDGAGAEAWILRLLLAGLLGALLAAVLGSREDILRYLQIRRM